jgi:hypothetical protein
MHRSIRVKAVALSVALLTGTAGSARAASTPLDFLTVDGEVQTLYRAGDCLYVGGDFASVRTRLDGAVTYGPAGDVTAPPFPRIDGAVYAVAADGTGGWFVGGSISRVGGQPVMHLAHITAAGAVDATFAPVPGNPVRALIRVGTSLYVSRSNGPIGNTLHKLSAVTGAVDGSFSASPSGPVEVLVHSGGSLYAGGAFGSFNGQSAINLAKLSAATGAVDATFNPVPNGPVHALWHDGASLFAGGAFTSIDEQTATPRLAKLDPANGTADTAFDPAPDQPVRALWHTGASLFAGGDFATVDGQGATPRLAKLDPANGTAALAFDPAPDQSVRALWHDGASLFAGGAFTAIDGHTMRITAAKLDPADGAADLGFDPDAEGTVSAIAVVGETVLVTGDLGHRSALDNLARVDLATGRVDAGFAPDPSGVVHTLEHDGTNLYVGGQFGTIDGQTGTPNLAKLSPDGTADPTFLNVPGANNPVFSLELAGTGLYVGTLMLPYLRRVDTNAGTLDAAFDAQLSGPVASLLHDGTSLYVGGNFDQVAQSFATPNLVKLDPATGIADAAFDPAPDMAARALWHDGTSLYAGGNFVQIDGQSQTTRVARLNPADGAADPAFNPRPNATVNALWHDGTHLYVGGQFTGIDGALQKPRLARVNPIDGSVDPSFEPAPDAAVRAVIVSSTTVFAGGDFADVGGPVEHTGLALFGPPRPRIAELPQLTGSAVAGGTLTCSEGSWSDVTLPFARLWLVDGAATGLKDTTFAVTAAHVGKAIACEVTARNGTGPRTAVSAAIVATAGPADEQPTPGATPTPQPTATPAPTQGPAVRDVVAPVLTGVRINRKRFKAKKGATFRFTLSEDATVSIRLTRTKPGRRRVLGTITRSLRGGARTIALPRRTGGKALTRGSYQAAISARDAAGNRSAAKTVRFSITR